MDGKHLKPGDTLVMVNRWRHNTFTETITKVGRTWITLNSGRRVGIEPLQAEDFHNLDVFLTVEQYNNHKKLARHWAQLRHAAAQRYKVPEGVTAEKIEQAIELLGLA